MDGITKELAAKAAEDYKVSAQNREAWEAGYVAGFLQGKVVAYWSVAKSCAGLADTQKEELIASRSEK